MLVTLNILMEFSFVLFYFIFLFFALISIRFHIFERHSSSSIFFSSIAYFPFQFIRILNLFIVISRISSIQRVQTVFYFHSIYRDQFYEMNTLPMHCVHTFHHTSYIYMPALQHYKHPSRKKTNNAKNIQSTLVLILTFSITHQCINILQY